MSDDAAAAHEFLSEIRTRIVTQPLPRQYGAEAQALESLWGLFSHARTIMRKYTGCRGFAAAVTNMLNVDVRPVTAKWDRAHHQGRLDSQDGADEFRADLVPLQLKLRRFSAILQEMAYGSESPIVPDELTPPAISPGELMELFRDLPFGIAGGPHISDDTVLLMNESEAHDVMERRNRLLTSQKASMNGVGLGLSGGGIRSATFCLGVVQVLASRGLLKEVDFLSTVSGGGYTGCFLTKRLGSGTPEYELSGPHGPDPAPIRFLRQHAKYLSAINLKQSWAMATETLAGMLLNWSAPLLVVTLAALAGGTSLRYFKIPSFWPIAFGISITLTGVALVLYCGLIRIGPSAARVAGWLLGLSMALAALAGVGWLLASIYVAIPHLFNLGFTITGAAAALVAIAPIFLRFLPFVESARTRKLLQRVLLGMAGLAIPILGLSLFYAGIYLDGILQHMSGSVWSVLHYVDGHTILAAVAAVLGFIAIFLLNVNLTAPHRMYRDRLAAAFISVSEKDRKPIPLGDLNHRGTAPYHLINTTVNLPTSVDPALRDRKSDFFLFSKYWCGSPIVGYHETDKWKTNNDRPDLATAMAISGAAASSHMGLGSMPTLVALLTFLNVRLGFWICQPGRMRFPRVPGFVCLIREMTGIAMSEKQAWLNLSDGGHIENMATYELLRRRCKFVICVDGECDPAFAFQGLMTLVRHAQLDLGVQIEPRLNEMRPDEKSNHSQSHSTLCRIHYPECGADRPAATGILLYVKLSITGDEPELIRRYRTIDSSFPHQTTLDQFFGEEQFEAYRELGVHVAEGLFSRILMGGADGPKNVSDWFQRLAANMLEAEAV